MMIFIFITIQHHHRCARTTANDKIIIRLSRDVNARDLFIFKAIAIIVVSIISILNIIFRLSPGTNTWEGAVNTIESRELHTSAVTRWPHHHDRHLCHSIGLEHQCLVCHLYQQPGPSTNWRLGVDINNWISDRLDVGLGVISFYCSSQSILSKKIMGWISSFNCCWQLMALRKRVSPWNRGGWVIAQSRSTRKLWSM